MTDSEGVKVGVVDETAHWTCPHCEQVIGIPSTQDLAARLAASEAEVAELRDKLGATVGREEAYRQEWITVVAERDSLRAERDSLRAERDSLRAKLEKLAEYAQHWRSCDKMKQMPTESNRDYLPCTCGLAALQSSEKGL